MMPAILQALMVVLSVAAALVLPGVANIRRERRYQQWLMPAVTVLFAITVIVILYRFNVWLDDLLNAIFQFLPFLANFYETRWLYLAQNALIIAAFLAVKILYGQLAKLFFRGEKFLGSPVVEKFYDYDAGAGLWFVKPSLAQMRRFYLVLFITSICITAGIFLAMHLAPGWPGFAAISFPAVATVVLGEVYHALNGRTAEESQDVMFGEQDEAHRITNYAALRDIFRRTFPERVIDDGVDLSGPYSLNSHQALTELENSPDAVDRLVGEYFERVKNADVLVDENLVHMSLDVLKGTSVLINSPFYTDLTQYLALPSYIRLLGGGKCLIIVGRDSSADDVVEWFERGLEGITGVPDLWDTRVLGPHAVEDLDVGILRAADLHNFELLAANDAFLRDVETVILMEPSRIMATGQLGLGIVVSRLQRGEKPVFVAFDRNHDGLVDALSHLLKVSLTTVVATQPSVGTTSEMVWRAEGQNLAPRIIPGIARYLGVGTEIATVALKYHVSKVEWVGGESFPVTDMSWIAGQYFSQISSFAELEASQRSLASALIAQKNPLSLERRDVNFLIVEDEVANVYESLRLYGSRSTESGFVNLISENYLLRDYMVDNREMFAADAKAIPSFAPDFARTRRNTLLRLLMMLSSFGVSEETLLRELDLVGCRPEPDGIPEEHRREAPVVTLFTALAKEYLGLEEVPLESFSSSTPLPMGGASAVSYRLAPGANPGGIVHELRPAYFLVEDEVEGRDYVGACLQGHVSQTLLPGQFVTVGGKYYEVVTIGSRDRAGEVVLRRAAEHINGRPAYRLLRSFTISDAVAPEELSPRVEGQEVTIERLVATVTAETHGYLEVQTRDDLASAKHISIADIPPRVYEKKDVLRIAVPGTSSEVRRTLAVLLNEAFVTFFPTAHNFLVAVTAGSNDAADGLLPAFVSDDSEAIYIVEDSLIDMGLLVAAHRNWRRIFETVTDYLAWLETPPPPPPQETVVTFEDETEEERLERERRISVAVERGAYEEPPKPKKPSWFTRVRNKIKGWFTRKSKPEEADAAEELDVQEPDALGVEEVVVETENAPEEAVETVEPAEPEALSEPEFVVDFASDGEVQAEAVKEPTIPAVPVATENVEVDEPVVEAETLDEPELPEAADAAETPSEVDETGTADPEAPELEEVPGDKE